MKLKEVRPVELNSDGVPSANPEYTTAPYELTVFETTDDPTAQFGLKIGITKRDTPGCVKRYPIRFVEVK